MTCRGGKGRGREQKTSFLRKEPNECTACLVSMKQRFSIAAFSSKPPPGHSSELLVLICLQKSAQTQPIDDILCFSKVDLVQRTSDFIFHVLYQAPDVGYVWGAVTHSFIFLHLSGKAASEVHGARAGFVGLQPQHHRGGQLVMGSAAAGFLLHFYHVDGIPAAFDLL